MNKIDEMNARHQEITAQFARQVPKHFRRYQSQSPDELRESRRLIEEHMEIAHYVVLHGHDRTSQQKMDEIIGKLTATLERLERVKYGIGCWMHGGVWSVKGGWIEREKPLTVSANGV